MTIPRKSKLLWGGLAAACILLGVAAWFMFIRDTTSSVSSAVVVHAVARGSVSNGIVTTGKIEAAEILDLNVYKLEHRIETVNATNGQHVEAGELILAFDESDASVDVTTSKLDLEKARLERSVAAGKATDPNTTITALKNEIAVLKQNLVDYGVQRRDALRTFLNANIEAEPSAARYDEQIVKTAPTISGVYNSTLEGEYVIEVYKSSEDSGFSYRLTGLESGVFPVYIGSASPLGTHGLKITFPADVAARDTWIVALPNSYAPEYAVNKKNFDTSISDLNEKTKTDTVGLGNKEVALEQAQREDTGAQRNLDVDTAELAIERAQVALSKGVDARDERRIVAPFSGSVEGMENVVIGATPTRDTNDSVNLGSLISDEFMVTFSLGASEVDRVEVGQKVYVTLSSVPGSAPLVAEVVEKSSLPDTGAVAEYAVRARMASTSEDGVTLRDGMLADIEIVEEERENVLRVPSAALTYTDRVPTVTAIEGLDETERNVALDTGILRAAPDTYTTLPTQVTVGLRGTYYTEITAGVTEGMLIVVTSVGENDAAPSVQTGFGGRSGGGRPRGPESEEDGQESQSDE